jgi:hypothetical protein
MLGHNYWTTSVDKIPAVQSALERHKRAEERRK